MHPTQGWEQEFRKNQYQNDIQKWYLEVVNEKR